MRQSKAESPVKTPQVPSLHPVLHHALANLDVQLEEELARYRRQRLGGARPPQPANRRSAPKTLDLISVSPNGGQRQTVPTPTVPTRAEQFSPGMPAAQATVTQGITAQETVAQNAGVQNVGLQNVGVQHAAVQEASPWDSLERPVVPPVTPPPPPRPTDPDTFAHQLSSELAIAPAPHPLDEMDDLLAGNADAENALQAKSGVALEDYLESSEELLRSLAEEEAKVQAERGFMQSLLTPLGVGSMLLLLLSSAMFGYVVMNPSGLSRMFAARDANSANEATSGATDGTTNGTTALQGTSPQAAPAQGTTAAPQPNLAAKEFKDLNLNTLGTLRPGNTPALNALPKSALPTAQASPTAPAIPGNPAIPGAPAVQQPQSTGSVQSAAPAPAIQSVPIHTSRSSARTAAPRTSARPYVAPEPPRYQAPPAPRSAAPSQSYAPPVQRSTAPPPSAPAPAPSHTAANYPYKVEINFEGDRTLNETRKVVPDAYLQNLPDGAKVQAGAFSSEADAAARVQELQKQGISAEVRKR